MLTTEQYTSLSRKREFTSGLKRGRRNWPRPKIPGSEQLDSGAIGVPIIVFNEDDLPDLTRKPDREGWPKELIVGTTIMEQSTITPRDSSRTTFDATI